MTQSDRRHWDERYRSGTGPCGRGADARLVPFAEHVDRLHADLGNAGRTPRALDVACGAGGTLVWLAQRGWRVVGVDASGEALQLAADALAAATTAAQAQLIQADLDHWRPPANAFDLVTCFFFLDRSLMPGLRQAVQPGGLLIMETFNRHWLERRPDANPDFLLAEDELAQWILKWQWHTLTMRTNDPHADRPTDAIVAQRPARQTAVRQDEEMLNEI